MRVARFKTLISPSLAKALTSVCQSCMLEHREVSNSHCRIHSVFSELIIDAFYFHFSLEDAEISFHSGKCC